MRKLLTTPILAMLLSQASLAQAPRSNNSVSPAPNTVAAPHTVRKTKISTARVLSADDRAVLTKATQLFPNSLAERSAYLIKAGKPLLALPELDKLIKENPQLVEGYVAKAKIYDDLHRFDEAQTCLRKALSIQSDYQPARILLATVAIKKGDLDGAMKELGQSFGVALATKVGVIPQPEIRSVKRAALVPLSEMPGAWILQSLHMLIAPKVAIERSTTSNPAQTFDGASVVESLPPPLPPPKLAALKPREDRAENHVRQEERQAPALNESSQKSMLVFTREIEEKPVISAEPIKKNALKFISDEEDSTIESAQLPTEQLAVAIAKAPPAIAPVVSASLPAVESPKPAPLHYSPENLEKSALGLVASANNIAPAALSFDKGSDKVTLSPPDQWTEKLKYLAEHGTAELDEGEAFMFAEDTGEATLFLANGKKIRRVISQPRDNEVVVATRRPELLKAEDLVYRLALLAKLMPNYAMPPEAKAEGQAGVKIAAAESKPSASTFNADSVLGRNDGFVGWLKHLFPF